jgi:hypothetical protein
MNRSRAPLVPALLKTIIISGTLFIGISLANAAPANMRSVCNNYLCIYDTHGTIVGIFFPTNLLARLIRGTWYGLPFSQAGLLRYLITYYAASGCTGQAMVVLHDTVLHEAMYDGQSVWTAVGTPTSLSWSSYQYIDPYGGTTCVNAGSPTTASLAIAKKIESPVLYPPLNIK